MANGSIIIIAGGVGGSWLCLDRIYLIPSSAVNWQSIFYIFPPPLLYTLLAKTDPPPFPPKTMESPYNNLHLQCILFRCITYNWFWHLVIVQVTDAVKWREQNCPQVQIGPHLSRGQFKKPENQRKLVNVCLTVLERQTVTCWGLHVLVKALKQTGCNIHDKRMFI